MNEQTYLYFTNYPDYERELCEMEQAYLFGTPQVPYQKYRFSTQLISIHESPFFRQRINVSFQAITLDELVVAVKEAKLYHEDFKIHYLKSDEDEIGYRERLQACKAVGQFIDGEANMQNPQVNFALTQVGGQWIFGLMEQHDAKWQDRTSKPHSYSNSLNNKVAKAAVNIAKSGVANPTIIDPCCGAGTVVIEALEQGLNMKGYEINPLVASHARQNVLHFGFEDVITLGDMHTITEHFDVAIVDIPYGLYTPTTDQAQLEILTTAKRIADKLILLTCENLDNKLKQAGYTTIQTCAVNKNNHFTRYLCVCE